MFRIFSDSQITLAGSGTTTLNFGQPISISGTLYGTTLSINTTSFMNDLRSNNTISVGDSEYVNSNVSVGGSEFVGGNVSISGILYNNGAVSISGPTTLQNTVSVSGRATLQSTVSISGLTFLQDRLSVAHTIYTDRNLSVSGIIFANNIQSAVFNPSSAVDGSGVGSYVLNIGMNDGPNTINIGQPGDIINIGGSKTIVNATEVQLSVSGTIFGTQLSLQNNAVIRGNVSVIGNLQTTGTTNLADAVLGGNLTVNGASNNVIAGTNIFSGSTRFGSELNVAPLTISSFTSNTINITTYSMIRVAASGTITSINTTSPPAGYSKVITIINASTGKLIFKHSSTPSNLNISTPSKNDVILPVGGSIQLALDLTSSPNLWYVTAVGGDGASNMNRLRTNATTIAAGVGSFGTYGTGQGLTNMYLPLNSTNTALENGMFILSSVLPNNNRIDSIMYGTSSLLTPDNGDIILLQNASSSTIVIYDYSSSSPTGLPSNAFKIITGTSSPLTLAKNSTVILSYNSTTTAWYITGGSGSGSGGSKKQWYQPNTDLNSSNSAGQTLVSQPLAQVGLSIGLPLTLVQSTANSSANGGLPGSYAISDAISSANAEVVGVLSNVLDSAGGLVEITLGGEVSGIPQYYIREFSGTTPVSSFSLLSVGTPVYLNSNLSVQYGATSYVNDAFPTYIVPRYTITDPSASGTAYATGIVYKPMGVISSVSISAKTFNMILYNQRTNFAGQNTVTRVQLNSTNGTTSNVIQLANFDSGKIMGNVNLTNTGYSGYPYNSRFYLESNFSKSSSGAYQATWQTSGDNSGGFALSVSGTYLHTIVGSPLSISGPSFISYSMSGMTVGSQSAVAALSVPLTSDAMRFNYIAPNTTSGMKFMNYNANLSLATPLLSLDNSGRLDLVGDTVIRTSNNTGCLRLVSDSNANYIQSGLSVVSGSAADLIFSPVAGTEWMRIKSNGNVGIGTTNPQTKLDILNGYIGVANSSNTYQAKGIAITNHESKGYEINVSGTSGWSTSGSLGFYNGTNFTMAMTPNGNVGIGTASPVVYARVHIMGNSGDTPLALQYTTGIVGGTGTNAGSPYGVWKVGPGGDDLFYIWKNGSGYAFFSGSSSTWQFGSDINMKKNIEYIENSLSKIKEIRPIKYNWNSESDEDSKHYGVIAQDVQKVAPEIVSKSSITGVERLSVGYTELIPLLIGSIQELSAENESLKTQIGMIQQQMSDILNRLSMANL